MAVNNDKLLAGYPQAIGDKWEVVVDHYGPVNYQQSTGDVYSSTSLNQGGFDRVEAGTSFSGTYTVQVWYNSSFAGLGVPSVKLVWYTNGSTQVANGTNLNGEIVRLRALVY
jgi:hypothetical protein